MNTLVRLTHKNFIFTSETSVNACFVFLRTSQLSLEVHNGDNDDANEKQSRQDSTDYCTNLTLTATLQQRYIVV